MGVSGSIVASVKKRLNDDNISEELVKELARVVNDRLCIRLGENALPELFESICVDATVKMYRRIYYEGIASEGAADISTSFVDNIMAEYEQEISDWKSQKSNATGSGREVRLL